MEIYNDFKRYQELFELEYKDYTEYYKTSKGKIAIRNYNNGFNFVYLCDEPLSKKIEERTYINL